MRKRNPQTEETKRKISLANKGKPKPPFTEEHKRKLSEAGKGKHISEETKLKMSLVQSGEKGYWFGKTGKEHPVYGKKHSLETCKKMSKARMGKLLSDETRHKMSLAKMGNKYNPGSPGESNPNWTGGNLPYWSKMALLREDYTCQVCGLRDEEIMEVDHMLPKSIYPDLILDINNLQVLCPNCHRRKTIREMKKIFDFRRKNDR